MPEATLPDEQIEFADTFRGVGTDRARKRIILIFEKVGEFLNVSVPEGASGKMIAGLLAAAVHEQSQVDAEFKRLLPGSPMSSTQAMSIETVLVGDQLPQGDIPVAIQLRAGIRFDLTLGRASAEALRNGLILALGQAPGTKSQ